jgi:hypothetical protein
MQPTHTDDPHNQRPRVPTAVDIWLIIALGTATALLATCCLRFTPRTQRTTPTPRPTPQAMLHRADTSTDFRHSLSLRRPFDWHVPVP